MKNRIDLLLQAVFEVTDKDNYTILVNKDLKLEKNNGQDKYSKLRNGSEFPLENFAAFLAIYEYLEEVNLTIVYPFGSMK